MSRTAVAAIADAYNDYTASFDNQNRMLDGAKKERCWKLCGGEKKLTGNSSVKLREKGRKRGRGVFRLQQYADVNT